MYGLDWERNASFILQSELLTKSQFSGHIKEDTKHGIKIITNNLYDIHSQYQ